MAKVSQKIRREWDPLHASFNLTTIGGSAHQLHSADNNKWIPDRTITPLTIRPIMYCTDPSVSNPQPVDFTSKLTRFTWKEQIGANAPTTISSNSEYVISSTGATKGQLIVKKNVTHASTITLHFEGYYLDDRTGNSIVGGGSIILTCTSQSQTPLKLELDHPEGIRFDPIVDSVSTYKITPKLYLADQLLNYPKAQLWWYKKVGGTYTEIKTLTATQKPEFVSSDNVSLTVDLAYLDQADYKVIMDYSKDDSVLLAPSQRAVSKTFTLIRSYSRFYESFDILGGGRVHQGDANAARIIKGIVTDNNGRVIPHAADIFNFTYKLTKGSTTKTIGNTINVEVPLADISALTGNDELIIEMEVTTKAPKTK